MIPVEIMFIFKFRAMNYFYAFIYLNACPNLLVSLFLTLKKRCSYFRNVLLYLLCRFLAVLNCVFLLAAYSVLKLCSNHVKDISIAVFQYGKPQ